MSIKITNRKKFIIISGLTSLVTLCLILFTLWLNPQLLFSPTEQSKIKAVIITTPPNSPIPTPTPNPCNYEISFSESPPIREGSRVIRGQCVPSVQIQIWNSRNGSLVGQTICKNNGTFVMNRIRPLTEGDNLLLTLRHDNNPYFPTMVVGTDYKLSDFNCLMSENSFSLPIYLSAFEQYPVQKRGVIE